MSTKALPRRPPPLLAALSITAVSAAVLGACAAPPPTGPVARFSELRLGAPPPGATTPQPVALRPRLAAPAAASPVLPVSLAAATARVAAYLGRSGFALEQRPEGEGERLTATRMGAPRALDGEAVCALEAMHRPDISSTDVVVELSPAPGGVQLHADARFVEVDTRLIAGTLSRQTCRSQGALEAAVRRAALGG